MGPLYQPQAPSAEVEMTSYVLLAHLTAQPGPTSEDLTSATGIVSWILKQQNAHGGFSSTQVCGSQIVFSSRFTWQMGSLKTEQLRGNEKRPLNHGEGSLGIFEDSGNLKETDLRHSPKTLFPSAMLTPYPCGY